MTRKFAVKRERKRSCTGTRQHTLPALAAVLLPAHADPARAGAILATAINNSTFWPMTAEVVQAQSAPGPQVGQEQLGCRQLAGFVLVIQVSNAGGRPAESKLLKAASKAAAKALREEFGTPSNCSVQPASNTTELDLCWHSVIGRPRHDIP